jgi:tripartite-type tricarboxylate transporter receptor subunit TctC
MGGRISMIVESVGALSGAVQSGSVKALGVASARRLTNLPDLPTVAETSPGFEAVGWFVLSGPSKIPHDLVQTINHDLNRVLAGAELKQKLQDLGASARPISPNETAEFIRKEELVWRPLVRQMGLSAE